MFAHRRLSPEWLEDRSVPATWGNPWPDATHLTLSFAPDGTTLAGQASNLFALLNGVAPQAVWQREILRAFQTWAVHANITIGLVADSGEAFGTGGRPQGDPRFGDIRLGATGHADGNALIFTSPFDLMAGTWSGDIRFNSTVDFRVGGVGGYDIYTAMLQEAGHVFGLFNSDLPSSVMYEQYLGVRSGLSAEDIAALQALYGARQPDGHEGATGNETLASATVLSLLADASGVLAVAADGDLTTMGDRDVYQLQAPALLGGMEIRLRRAGLSLLTPRVTVYNASGQVVGSAVSTDPMGGDLVIHLNGVTPLGSYYVAVEGASGDLFDVGSYQLTVQSLPIVNFLTGALADAVETIGQGLANNDLHLNDSLLTAQNLLGTLFAPDSRFDHAYQASISDSWDVDFYRVQAPATAAGQNVLSVVVWPTGSSQLLPRVSVLDANGNLLAAELLFNEAGVVAVQVVGVTAGATYYVKVESAVASGTGRVGNYFLGIDFGPRAALLQTFLEGTLDVSQPLMVQQLSVDQTVLYHFVLEADSADDPSGAPGVELTIRDHTGRVVGQLRVAAGDPASLTLTLEPGLYDLEVRPWRADGQPIGSVQFRLRGTKLTDPIGPRTEDPTEAPSRGTPPAAVPPPPPPPENVQATNPSPPLANDPAVPPVADAPGSPAITPVDPTPTPTPTPPDTAPVLAPSDPTWYNVSLGGSSSQASNQPKSDGSEQASAGPAAEDPHSIGYRLAQSSGAEPTTGRVAPEEGIASRAGTEGGASLPWNTPRAQAVGFSGPGGQNLGRDLPAPVLQAPMEGGAGGERRGVSPPVLEGLTHGTGSVSDRVSPRWPFVFLGGAPGVGWASRAMASASLPAAGVIPWFFLRGGVGSLGTWASDSTSASTTTAGSASNQARYADLAVSVPAVLMMLHLVHGAEGSAERRVQSAE